MPSKKSIVKIGIMPVVSIVAALSCVTNLIPKNADANGTQSDGKKSSEQLAPDARQTRRAAIRQSSGRAVLYYGAGFQGADAIAQGLTEAGCPAVAIAGGPPSKVEVFIDAKAIMGPYTFTEAFDGTLGNDVEEACFQAFKGR